jgi:hypothetical protein
VAQAQFVHTISIVSAAYRCKQLTFVTRIKEQSMSSHIGDADKLKWSPLTWNLSLVTRFVATRL